MHLLFEYTLQYNKMRISSFSLANSEIAFERNSGKLYLSIVNWFEIDDLWQTIDIYSFGMIVWEVYTSGKLIIISNYHKDNKPILPFGDNYEVAREYVFNKKSRPKIGLDFPEGIKFIIKKWWSQEPRDRFQNFKDISELFNELEI